MIEVVGRGPEIARVVRWSADEGPVMLLLEGPPGLGKTTIWQAALDELRERGIHVLSSVPTEAESRLSYSGLADLLGAEIADLRSALPPPQVRALAVALRLDDPGDRPVDETAVARGALEGFRVLARRYGPVVVAIDDLRWLDAPSLATVIYVARRLGPRDGIRILATHRTGTAVPSGLDRVPAVLRMTLDPMSVGGLHRIVRLHAGISLARPRLLEIHAMTLGNPLHAIELARSTGAGHATDDDTLASLFAARIRVLPQPTRSSLVLVAASADRSSDRLGAAWASVPGASPDHSFADAIGAAVAADLVSIGGGSARPAHPLVTHVAYEMADPIARRAAHRALAETATDEEERALHLGRSVDGSDADVAAVIESAALGVRVRGVRAVSATLFERAAAITPSATADEAGRRWLAAAAAWFDAGDTHRVERILEPLIETWPAGRQRAEARWRLGIALDEAGRWPDATNLWRAALDDTDDPSLRSQVRCSLAVTAMYTDSLPAAIAWATSAVDDAERSADPSALARSLAVNAFILVMAGRRGGEALMDRALAMEATIDDHLGEWSPTALAAECARHTGDIPVALRHYATVLERATARGDANIEQWAAFGLASAAILAGEIGRASGLADLVLDIAEQTDVMRIPARSLRAHVDAYQGKLEAARTMLAEAMALARAGDEAAHLFGAYVVLGTIETCAGDPAAAAAALREARSLATRLGFAHATALRCCLLEVEVAAMAGELSQADEALAAFDGQAPGSPRWSVPLRRRAIAARYIARGDVAAAIPELEAAADDAIALPPDVARALLALAAVLRRERRYRQARDVAERAAAQFTDLGMRSFAAAAERELARIPGRRVVTDRELTVAEARIAGLVAAGRTNKAVAAELVLSVKTVEVTLTRVYEKLGVRSRTELAAHFRDRPVPSHEAPAAGGGSLARPKV
jgi:DNA-binding NarL/FixJ family response regulator